MERMAQQGDPLGKAGLQDRRQLPQSVITWRVVASVLGALLVLFGTAWMSKTDTRIESLEKSQSEIGREVSAIKAAVNSLSVTTDSRLGQLETNISALGREILGVSASTKSLAAVQGQIIDSLREMRDDLKTILRGK